jgi:hypothetical protein
MPKMVFYMPTVASVTTTAGYFLASKMGLITRISNCVLDYYSLNYCHNNGYSRA